MTAQGQPYLDSEARQSQLPEQEAECGCEGVSVRLSELALIGWGISNPGNQVTTAIH